MKILYILHSTIMGGATISFLNLLSEIKKKGNEVIVIIPDTNNEFISKITNWDISYYKSPIVMSVILPSWNKLSIRNKFGYLLKLIKSKYYSYRLLLEIIKKEKPDIIHTNVGVVQEGFFCARKLGIPHIWHLREYQDIDFKWKIFPSKWVFKHLLLKSNVISITKDIHKAFNLSENRRHRVIYNGIFPKTTSYMEFPKEKYFLCASRISEEKGYEDTIKAFAEFHKYYPDYSLIILGFGSDSYIQKLKQLAQVLECSDHICFKGYTNNVISYMKRATALIVASYNEGFGRMTAEAAFSGCLIIGRNTSGTKEILDQIGGLKFDNLNDLISNMLISVNMDELGYRNIVSSAQNKAKELYSNENNVDKIHKFYLDINNKIK